MDIDSENEISLFHLIKADFKRKQAIFLADGFDVPMWKILLSDGTAANVIYRFMQFSSRHRLLPLAIFFQYLNKLLNHCVIGIKANFSNGLVIMHPVGIVINSKVSGGINITLESGVVMGDAKGASPLLGNTIFIGSGAKIIGGMTIGDAVNIGANAVVVKDVPSNTTAVGVPAKLIPHTL